MLTTYEAILRDNKVEWQDEAPRHIAPGTAVNVHITVLNPLPSSRQGQGAEMAAALENLARSQSLAGLDAEKWQRDLRTERILPGRID